MCVFAFILRSKWKLLRRKSEINREKYTERKQTNRTNVKREGAEGRSKSEWNEVLPRWNNITTKPIFKQWNENSSTPSRWSLFLSFPFNFFVYFVLNARKHIYIAECWFGAQRPFQYYVRYYNFYRQFCECSNVFFLYVFIVFSIVFLFFWVTLLPHIFVVFS